MALSDSEKHYDTWEQVHSAGGLIRKVIFDLCEIKPKAESPEIRAWNVAMTEARKMAVHVHDRAINLLQKEANRKRKSVMTSGKKPTFRSREDFWGAVFYLVVCAAVALASLVVITHA